jgi:hypothetical protein
MPTGGQMAAVDFDLSYELEFFKLPPAGRNLGITALNARRASVDQWDVFVRVDAGSAASSSGQLEVLVNGAPLQEPEPVSLERSSQRLVFRVDHASRPHRSGSPPTAVALASDRPISIADRPRTAVCCATGLATYRHALANMPGIWWIPMPRKIDDDGLRRGDFDTMTTSRKATTYLLVAPARCATLITRETGFAEVVDWARLAPAACSGDVVISDVPKRVAGVEDGDFEELGYESALAPMPLILRSGRSQAYYSLLFNTEMTLPYRVSSRS